MTEPHEHIVLRCEPEELRAVDGWRQFRAGDEVTLIVRCQMGSEAVRAFMYEWRNRWSTTNG